MLKLLVLLGLGGLGYFLYKKYNKSSAGPVAGSGAGSDLPPKQPQKRKAK